MKAYWCKATLFVVALSGYALAQSDAPSLAEVARQSREAKKKATLVLSDEDQRFSKSATASTNAAASHAIVANAQLASAATAPKADGSKSASPAEAKNAPAASSAKQKLDFYKSELESWKGIAKRDEDLLANETVPFRQQMYQDALDGDRQTMAFFQQKADELQSEINKSQKESLESTGATNSSSGSGR